jgi:3-oxoacyl-[acyl-carrier-protein] synthase III
MRYEGVYLTGVGVELGLEARCAALVRRGVLTVEDARRTRQRSVCVASVSGPDLAVTAARAAVASHERTTGGRPMIRAHLHAQMVTKPDVSSVACYVLNELGVSGCGVVCDIGAMSNGMVLGLDVAASLVGARPDVHTALITAGDRFAGSGFDRYRSDHGVLYGDAGAALVVSRMPGFARVVSVATCTDPGLEGLTREAPPGARFPPCEVAGTDRGVIDVGQRQRVWSRGHGGAVEVLRRNRVGLTTATRIALADAGITLDEARWVVVPFMGYEAVRARWLRPLGISEDGENRTLVLLGLHFGHLGAADHVVGLRHLMATGAVAPGDYVVLASSGAGMSWTTAVLQMADVGDWPPEPDELAPDSVFERGVRPGGWMGAGETFRGVTPYYRFRSGAGCAVDEAR